MSSSLSLYRPTGARAEHLDPRTKIVAALSVTAAAVVAPGTLAKGAIVVLLVACWVAARLRAQTLVVTVASLAVFFLSALALHGIVDPPQDPGRVVRVVRLSVSLAGLGVGAALCLQIAAIALALSLLVRSTPPVVLAEGAERLLSPFTKLGLPTHEAVLMFSLALRFIPVVADEFERLHTAQLARGAAVHRHGLLARLRAVFPNLLPMMIATIVRAHAISEAMDSRCYRGKEGRTAIRSYHLGPPDYALVLGGLVILAAAVGVHCN